MDIKLIIFGILCIVAGVLFLIYDKSLWTKEDTKRAKESGMDDLTLFNIRFSSKISDIKGLVGGYGLVLVGILFIYLAFKGEKW